MNRDVCWGGAICSLKRETRLSARNTEIKNPATFFTKWPGKNNFYFLTVLRLIEMSQNQNLAPLTGLEPVTYGLTVRRSTD